VTDEAHFKLSLEYAKRYANRNGGYTRIVRLKHRIGDGAQLASIEFLHLP